MAAIARRSMRSLVSRYFTLAAADDLDGTTDNTQAADISGASRVLIFQVNDGTAGTAGIDVIEYSFDGGSNWSAATDVLAADSNDVSGTVLASGALNAAGVEPPASALFKCGPFNGKVAIRCARKTTETGGTTWVTGAPTVKIVAIGLGGGSLTALA